MKTKAKLLAALKIWVVIYPALTFALYAFKEPLSVLPVYQRTFLLTIALVPLVVFAGVPFVNFLLSRLSAGNSGKPG